MSPRRKKVEALAVVLHPGLIPLGFYEDSVRRLLLLWRNGQIRLQMCRPLAAAALELLTQIGLEEDELRRWALWMCDGRRSDMHRTESETIVGAVAELSGAGHRVVGLNLAEVAVFVDELESMV